MATKLERLIEAYGNAQFDCGEWTSDADREWEEVRRDCEAAHAALLAYLKPRLGTPASAEEPANG